MTIDISDNNPRVIYTVAQGVTQTSFAVPFEFFADSDLNVYVDNVLKTITTHYTVSGGDGSTGTVTMSVTGATGGSKVAITRDVTIERVTDFTPGVEINRAALNTQLDTLTAIAADVKDQALRALRVQDSDITTSLEIPLAATRANKVFAFDSTGAVSITNEIGSYEGNWASARAYLERDIVKDTSNNNIYICLVAHTSSGSQPISTNVDVAKWGLLVDAAAVATSASNAASSASAAASSASAASSSASAASSSASAASSSASAAASSASSAASEASNAASSASAAAASYDSFDDRYLGPKSSNPTLDNDGAALLTGALYFNTSANEMRVYNGSSWLAGYLPATGYATLTGSETLTNKTLTDPALIGTILEDVFTITDGAAFEIDPGNGSVQLITLGASRTPKATNFAAGEAVTLMVDDGSAYTLTWTDATFGGSGVVWKTDGGVAPTLNTSGYTVIVLWKVSTQVYGARVGDA
jgi:hypothetical protein